MFGRPSHIVAGGTGLAFFVFTAISATGVAAPLASVDVYGANAQAAGVHVVGYSSNFPNFSTGAIDNRYPMATAGMDAAPSARAVASVNDYGPLGANLATNGAPRVPYAEAQFPAPPGKPHDSYTHGPDSSVADAREFGADSSGTYNGDPTQPVRSSTAESHVVISGEGAITATTHAHVSNADFGGGALHIGNVDVIAKVISVGGKGTPSATVTVTGATANGAPITITDKEITIQGTPVPVSPGTTLGTPLIKVFSVAPEMKHEGANASVVATGVHVVVTQPAPPGVPTQSAEYILGEGAAEGFAIPAVPEVAGVDTSGLGVVATDPGFSAPTTTVISNTITSPSNPTGYTGAPVNNAPKTPSKVKRPVRHVALVQPVRPPLAMLFFLWEALVLGTAGALVWARRSRPEGA
jgi:hypothetical protein